MKSEIITWLAGLPDNAPELARVDTIRRGADAPAQPEPLLSLKERSVALGFKSYTALSKLRIQRVGEIGRANV